MLTNLIVVDINTFCDGPSIIFVAVFFWAEQIMFMNFGQIFSRKSCEPLSYRNLMPRLDS